MNRTQYGSATATDLYDLFIGSKALDTYEWWELVDDEDERPSGDGWYVIVDAKHPELGSITRITPARLWAAILACAPGRIESVPLAVAQRCEQIIVGWAVDRVTFTPPMADVVMQVAVYGEVEFQHEKEDTVHAGL